MKILENLSVLFLILFLLGCSKTEESKETPAPDLTINIVGTYIGTMDGDSAWATIIKETNNTVNLRANTTDPYHPWPGINYSNVKLADDGNGNVTLNYPGDNDLHPINGTSNGQILDFYWVYSKSSHFVGNKQK